jgi:hypothetical protein
LIDIRNEQAENYKELIEAMTIGQSLGNRPN